MNIKIIILPVVIAVILVLELIIPQERTESLKKRLPHDGKNLLIGIINVALTYLLGFFIAVRILKYGKDISFGFFHLFDLPVYLEVGLTFVLVDLWMYIWHRINHEVSLFWRFHRVHHSDLAMNFTSIYRFHTIEILLSMMVRTGVLFLLGINFEYLAIYELLFNGVTLFHHSSIYIPRQFDRVMRLIICTPFVHRIHHSTVVAETNANYGSVFSFWDRIFFSFRMRPDMENIIYGLDRFREEKWQTFVGLLITPFQSINKNKEKK